MTTQTIYDAVPYRSLARGATHVDRLAAIGRLLGMDAADPNHCRVLELGCGDGGNLLPMALSLPESRFVGIDLAPTAIERGRAAAASTRITNASLEVGDIADLSEDIGDFDYVIAHGVYSWVPADVRAALLRLIRERMRPEGLAFVSYNALPGDHIRGIVRQMMRMHTAGIEDPRKKLEQARALLQMLAQAPGEAGDVYRPLLKSEVGRALQTSDDLLFHDDLADISQPFFFTEFMRAAQDTGLQFASEAVFHSMNLSALPEELAALLSEVATRDLIAKEQYLDFLTCRGFRQTLLCHNEVHLEREVDVDRLAQFRFFCEARRVEPSEGEQGILFEHRNGSALRTDHELTLRALDRLLAANPRSVAFDDLARSAGATTEEDREALADVLFQAFSVGVLQLRLFEPELTLTPGERPRATAWARYTAHTGRTTNLYHELIELDEPAKQILPLADGERTVEALSEATGLERPLVLKTLSELARLGLIEE